MQSLNQVLEGPTPIPVHQLHILGKGDLRKIFHEEPASPQDVAKLWSNLIQSIQDADTDEKYLTATCNCIAVFLSSAAASPSHDLRKISADHTVLTDALNNAEKVLQRGKIKPALQVLETLVRLLKGTPLEGDGRNLLSDWAISRVNAIFVARSAPQVKSACIVLTCFIKRGHLLQVLEDVLARSLVGMADSWHRTQMRQGVLLLDYFDLHSKAPHLFMALLFAIQDLETRSAASKLFVTLTHADDWSIQRSPTYQAIEVLRFYIAQAPESFSDLANQILPLMIEEEQKFEGFVKAYQPASDFSSSELILYLAILRVGRLKRFLTEEDLPLLLALGLTESFGPVQTSMSTYQSFYSLMKLCSSDIRIHTYDLLTASFETAAVVPGDVLQCILTNIKYVHDDNDAHRRGEILSITRRFLKRLGSSNYNSKQLGEADEFDGVFMNRLQDFLTLELSPGISYTRHALALHVLQILVNLPGISSSLRIRDLIEPVLGAILDPFEDVRSTAGLVAKNLLAAGGTEIGSTFLSPRILQEAEALSCRTCRHDHADAAGRLWGLYIWNKSASLTDLSIATSFEAISNICQRLTKHLESCETLAPGTDFPLHALLYAINYSLEYLKDESPLTSVHVQLLNVCQKIWTLVQPHLCVDSPESATDDVEDQGPKDLLAYAWRALRDSSLVLQVILQTTQSDNTTVSIIGSVCLEQLTLLRHRGAFSTVAQTFNKCCEKARQSGSSFQGLLSSWYSIAQQEIAKQSKKHTRRSAGLPAMICSLLSPNEPDLFSTVYEDLRTKAVVPPPLEDDARNDRDLPQVHALNCLKDIMTNSKFRTITERYMSDLLEISARCLSSRIWSIRNSGLMLLKACMNRLETLGVETSASSMERSSLTSKRKQPIDLAISLLDQSSKNPGDSPTNPEGVFAGLELARYVGSDGMHTEILDSLIFQQLSSPIWTVREHAARLLAVRIAGKSPAGDDDSAIERYMPQASCSENELHGALLYLRCLLTLFDENENHEGSRCVIDLTRTWTKEISSTSKYRVSPYSKAALLDLINDIFLHKSDWPNRDALENFNDWTESISVHNTSPGHAYFYQRSLLNAVLRAFFGNRYRPERDHPIGKGIIRALLRDAAAACYVIERTKHLSFDDDPALLDLLTKLASMSTAEETQAASMTALAQHLEENDQAFDDRQFILVRECPRSDHHLGRDYQNAFIRFEGYMLQHKIAPRPGKLDHLRRRLRSWLSMVRVASEDFLELETRMNAVAALLRFCQCLAREIVRKDFQDEYGVGLELVSMIYNQLNDDDDDVRGLAASTARSLLEYWYPDMKWPLDLCPLASRETLASTMVSKFSPSPQLLELILSKVALGSREGVPESPGSTPGPFQTTVQERMDRITDSMHDLFAEEKQNLYLDEYEEIETWGNYLGACWVESRIDQNLLKSAVDWCSDGMKVMQSLIGPERLSDSRRSALIHPLGDTYHSDVLLLFLRVMKMALAIQTVQLYLLDHAPAETRVTVAEDMKRIGQPWKQLRIACTHTRVHPRLMKVVDPVIAT